MRKRQCSSCGPKHLPPTGKRCARTIELEELEDTASQEMPAQPWLEVLDAVKSLNTRMTSMETQLESQAESTSTSPAAEAPVNIDYLRRPDPLNARVDNYLASQAASSNLVTDVVALSLGGKLLKNPQASTVRRIRNPTLWPHQCIHRPGIPELSFDQLTLPEFVSGTCAILQLSEISQDEKATRVKHLQ